MPSVRVQFNRAGQCGTCGTPLSGKRAQAEFCSGKCRVAWHSAVKRLLAERGLLGNAGEKPAMVQSAAQEAMFGME